MGKIIHRVRQREAQARLNRAVAEAAPRPLALNMADPSCRPVVQVEMVGYGDSPAAEREAVRSRERNSWFRRLLGLT